MKLRTRLTTAAVLAALLAVPATAASTRFPDVSEGHPRAEDIEFVAEQGWFVGRANGSFSPEARITPSQMAVVLERAFPDGMTRAEFASFLRGGNWRVGEGQPTTTTTTTAPRYTTSRAWEGTCEGLYAAIVAGAYNEYGYPEDYDFQPRQYNWDRDTEGTGRFGYVQEDILRVTDWYKRFVTSTVFMCQGSAKLDNGSKVPMVIRAVYDAEGDIFYNYAFPSGGQPSCANAKRDGHTLDRYNFLYLYSADRDADQDRIMCEDALPEHELRVVGDAPPGGVAL